MEIYQIRAFVTVARLGHLTRAAEALSLTQPAVSAQIKALEQSLGVALFERSAGRMVLARSGEALLPTAEALLVLGAQLKSEAQQLQGALQGALDLGVPSERPEFLRLGDLASTLMQSLPLVELKTHVLAADALLEQVQADGWPPPCSSWPIRPGRCSGGRCAACATALPCPSPCATP